MIQTRTGDPDLGLLREGLRARIRKVTSTDPNLWPMQDVYVVQKYTMHFGWKTVAEFPESQDLARTQAENLYRDLERGGRL